MKEIFTISFLNKFILIMYITVIINFKKIEIWDQKYNKEGKLVLPYLLGKIY